MFRIQVRKKTPVVTRHTNTVSFVTAEIRYCTVCSKRQNPTDDSIHKDEEEREEDETRVPHPD